MGELGAQPGQYGQAGFEVGHLHELVGPVGYCYVTRSPHHRRDSGRLVEACLGAVGHHTDRRGATQQRPH